MSKTKIPFVTHVRTRKKTTDKNMVVIGGMSGVGAKGCLGYGLLAADLLLGIDNTDTLYRKAKRELSGPLLPTKAQKKWLFL